MNKTNVHIGGVIQHGLQHYGFKITSRNPNTVTTIKQDITSMLREKGYELSIANGYYDRKEG